MKQEIEVEQDGEMCMFYNPSKIMKLVPFILIIGGTSKQHKKNAMEGFSLKYRTIRLLLRHGLCAFY